jgi:fumarate reductase flavoprotein subunit
MEVIRVDIVVVGGGGAGLRAAIAAQQADPGVSVALVSKVVPMRSHTVAAEGGSAGVITRRRFAGPAFRGHRLGWRLAVRPGRGRVLRRHCTEEMVQLEHWGCPWSRKPDGSINVRFFGGMKVQRTWFAADKTGFHMLHTLFQTSLRFEGIRRYDEFFVAELMVEDGRVPGWSPSRSPPVRSCCSSQGGDPVHRRRRARLQPEHQRRHRHRRRHGHGLSHGVPLRDMEFVQYHPTALPGSGILITEGCRGEGGHLVNRTATATCRTTAWGPRPVAAPKAMELGPRDRLSQAFWHEERKPAAPSTPRQGHAVHLDLRHLGAQKIHERLPMITEVAKTFVGVDPVTDPDPGAAGRALHHGRRRPATATETTVPGPVRRGRVFQRRHPRRQPARFQFAGRDLVFGRVAGERAAAHVRTVPDADGMSVHRRAEAVQARLLALLRQDSGERVAVLRDELGACMEAGVGIFSTPAACARHARGWPSCATATAAASGWTTAAAPSTPSGCPRSNSASCSRWPRPWRTRR